MGTEFNNNTIEKAYARWAPIYDFVFGALFERARRSAAEAVNRIGGRVLEVGVGTGISLPDYGRATRLVGVDLSEPMLRKAQEKVRDLHLTNVEGLSVMDAERMAFPDSSFDVIVAQLVVTTVPNPEATLDEFVRVLKPGGEIVLVSRVGADKGPRRVVEQWLTPITRWLGWRLEFPWGRYERWVEQSGSVSVVERRAMPPFGHFSLIRFAKTKAPAAQPNRLEAQAAG